MEIISREENTEERALAVDLKENRGLYKASMKIAMKIKRSLRESKVTQRQLAETMGMDPAVLSRLLNGKANMELKTIVKFEEVLGINIIDRSISPYSSPVKDPVEVPKYIMEVHTVSWSVNVPSQSYYSQMTQ